MKCVAAALSAALLFMFAAGAAFAQAPPPVGAYGRLPAVSDVAISPNGERLVVAGFDGRRSTVQVINVASGVVERASAAPDDAKLRGVAWADDQRVLFYVSATIDFRHVTPAVYRAWGVRLPGRQSLVEYWRVDVMSLQGRREHYLIRR